MSENTRQPGSAKPAAAGERAAPRRVIHFVTGGFSGATQVALDLCRAGQAGGRMQVLLALRRKRNTDAARVEAIRAQGIAVEVLPGWSHLATIVALWRLCRRWQPQTLVAHGFPEHLLGRWAGWLAGVPRLLQVEHNTRERYTPWRRLQARWLAGRTEAMIGVSEGVRRRLVELGMPEAKTLAIPNGIELARFPSESLVPMAQREPQIVMVARFARQKDPLTLIRAVALLRDRGLSVPLKFAGAGARSHLKVAQREVERLGLQQQVEFLGQYREVPALLMRSRVFVLSTRWEGMPLALVEAMAAGCACVVSAAPGTEDVLEHGVSGLMVPAGQPGPLADAIEQLMRDAPLAERLGQAARQRAVDRFDAGLMLRRYAALIDR
jgi:glycosyltransferase involved in cell wall biosynthesis